ncbi:MAG: ankyrin repeat domain-containing protein [Pyrinomonadaceae bacterium]
MSKKSFIDSIEIKTPCSEDWNEMKGGDRTRFCSHCSKSVNNISAMTRKQAMRIARDAKGEICVRFIKNPQTNAPVFAGKLYQISRRAGIAAGILGASMAVSTLTYAQGTTGLIKRIPDSQIEASQEKQSEKNKSENKSASVEGTVLDPNGAVVAGATVTLKSIGISAGYNATATADEDGFYKFENLPGENYELSATAAGFKVTSRNIIISDGKESVVNPSLEVAGMTMGIMVSVEYENPLARAVSDNDLEEVENLIAKGENVNGRDENYNNITPLFLAVENGNVGMVETLLNFGAKVNARDDDKQTPLMRLDEDATAELARVLIKHGAKVNAVDSEGNTALILAAHTANSEVLQVLIDHEAFVNAQNKQGQTALMNAADADNPENVRALILARADVNLKNKDGETAWDLTANDEIEELLKSHGAISKDN